MNVLERNRSLVREKISDMTQGMEGGLAKIFGDEWKTIGTSGERKEFGRLFKAAVRQGEYPDIEWVRIENAGRFDVYRKR